MTGLLDKGWSGNIPNRGRNVSTGPNDRNMGKRELYVVPPDWTPWCEESSGTNELERCRGQIAQSLVCKKDDFDSYPEGAFERF